MTARSKRIRCFPDTSARETASRTSSACTKVWVANGDQVFLGRHVRTANRRRGTNQPQGVHRCPGTDEVTAGNGSSDHLGQDPLNRVGDLAVSRQFAQGDNVAPRNCRIRSAASGDRAEHLKVIAGVIRRPRHLELEREALNERPRCRPGSATSCGDRLVADTMQLVCIVNCCAPLRSAPDVSVSLRDNKTDAGESNNSSNTAMSAARKECSGLYWMRASAPASSAGRVEAAIQAGFVHALAEALDERDRAGERSG